MHRARPSRREVIAGASAFGTTSVLGCLGIGGDDEAEEDTDADDTDDAGIDVGDRSLHSLRPIELVDPEATTDSGFAARDDSITYVHGHGGETSHWHFAPLAVRDGDDRTVRVRYFDPNAEEIPVGPEETYRTTVALIEASPEGFVTVSTDVDLVTLSAESVGEGNLRFELRRDDEIRWESPPLEVEVVDPE